MALVAVIGLALAGLAGCGSPTPAVDAGEVPDGGCAASDAGCACEPGFAWGPAGCADVDECAAAAPPCGDGSCTNLAGAYLCSCPAGLQVVVVDGAPTCADVDECAANPSLCLPGGCVDEPGGYGCACGDGWRVTGDGGACVDVDECAEDEARCTVGAQPRAPGQCVNTPGGFACACPAGYAVTADGAGCADVDECALPGRCAAGEACVNAPGGFACSPCPAGLRPEGAGCVDADECAAAPCGPVAGATCADLPDGAGYVCACADGYAATAGPRPTCLDVDECAVDNGGCAQTCLNTLGGAACACADGFALAADGRGCDDVDECAAGTAGCSAAASCANVVGGARCTCLPGYAGDGFACADVDECAVGHGGCSPDATCTNTEGSRACACGDGWCGDGLACVDAAVCAAPTGLDGVPGDGAVLLRWDALPVATGWAVSRADGPAGPWRELGETTSPSFVDAGVVNEATYWYVVRTRSAVGDGPDSAAVAVTPVAPPDPPTGLSAAAGDGAVTLAWTPGVRATATRVRRMALPAGLVVELGPVAGAAFVDTGLVNGARYAYAVAAENPVGVSAYADDVEAMPLAAPGDVRAIAGDGQVAVFWRPSVGATTYEVQAAPAAAGPFAAVGSRTSTGFVDAPLPNGVPRHYRVLAISPLGPSAPSAGATATPQADATPLPPPDDPTRNLVGLNTWFNTDWDGTRAFVDAMKSSRPWQDAEVWNAPVGGVDALGWPTANASTVVFSGEPADYNGTYRLVFEGQATVSVMWVPGSVTNQRYDAATNTTTADVTFALVSRSSAGLIFRNTRRTADSPLGSGFRNARLYRPGYPADGSVTFTQPLLDGLGHARVVRTMEWVGGGSNVVVRWQDRATPAHATPLLPAPSYTAPDGTVFDSTLGVPLEHQLELCNRLMVDCWLQIPPVADDEYVRNVALAVRFGTDGTDPYAAPQAAPVYAPLHPGLRVYVELGNENWNGGAGFLSQKMFHAIAGHLPPDHPVMLPAPDSTWTVVWRYPAWRTAQISETFRAVFGDAAMMTRVRPVLMTQRGNGQNTMGAAFTWLASYVPTMPTPRRIDEVIYAGGGSGYYGVNAGVSALPDSFFAAGNYPDALSVRDFAIDSLWAYNFGVRHVAYEGGPGLSYSLGDNRTLNADPRMQTMVETAHATWSQMGGDLLVYYNLRGPSEWEFTPSMANLDTPKLRALDAISAAPRAAVTLGGALPGALVARSLSSTTIRSGYGYDYTIDGLPCAAGFMAGNFLAYPGHAAAPYAGTLTVRGYASATTRLGVWINGAYQGEITLAGLSGTAHLYDSTSVPVAVPAGLVVVRLEVLTGGFTLYSITL